jgi:hypothetical protein
MDFDKFRHLLANEELYLRRTDLFEGKDRWEALPPDAVGHGRIVDLFAPVGHGQTAT